MSVPEQPPEQSAGPDGGIIRVLAFAAVRDIVGAAEVEVHLPAPCTADEAMTLLLSRYPALAPHRRSIRIAVNGTYAFATDPVRPGDEIALIPPVAGG